MTPDTLDAASELTQQRIEMAVAAHRLNHSAVSATHCGECGDNLPEARRKAYPGFTMCVECQSNMELRKKIGRV
ncbi:TraR/DksA family transcriptional regulator [Salmonella enterica subsp. enterica]|nr:TraR/DksA family transcriptional regulator [Salmonella enterica subsp. enterica]EAQ5899767.1 TraR/DksA family transcriptional regulator [Salmonella enterica]EGI5966898.1 TraR/DksA family transcriptional regulator [Salmonella enterica subsp. enterica serovar Brunei]EAX6555757.1 TraR/DksA family transcriptional regulator [Salmonella enterica]EBA4614479.1 TraR/DksA family transcriptional regulator [Salmonella enterica]